MSRCEECAERRARFLNLLLELRIAAAVKEAAEALKSRGAKDGHVQ